MIDAKELIAVFRAMNGRDLLVFDGDRVIRAGPCQARTLKAAGAVCWTRLFFEAQVLAFLGTSPEVAARRRPKDLAELVDSLVSAERIRGAA